MVLTTSLFALVVGQSGNVAEPGLLAPKVLEAKSMRVLTVIKGYVDKQDTRFAAYWREKDPIVSERARTTSPTLILSRAKPQAVYPDSLIRVGFRASNGGLRSLTVILPQVGYPQRKFSNQECIDRALAIHKELFPDHAVTVRRSIVDREETKIDVLLGTVIPGSKYQTDTQAEYHMSLEFGIPSHVFFEPLHQVRNPRQLAVVPDKFLAEIVREAHDLSKWNGFDVRVGKPMYSRMLTYGTNLRDLSPQMRKDLEDGYSVLTYRVAAWNPETWNEKEQRYMRSILFVVDAITGKILSITEPSQYQGGVGSHPPVWRPGFDLRGTWTIEGASGTFSTSSTNSFEKTKVVTLRQGTRFVLADVDSKRKLVRWNGKAYAPSASMARKLF